MKKYKNIELAVELSGISLLSKEKLNVKTSLAVVKSSMKLGEANSAFELTRKNIAESYACKDDKGKFILSDKEVDGNIVKEYTFETPEIKLECTSKISELELIEVEVPVSYITEEDILLESHLTPQQTFALLSLVKK